MWIETKCIAYCAMARAHPRSHIGMCVCARVPFSFRLQYTHHISIVYAKPNYKIEIKLNETKKRNKYS